MNTHELNEDLLTRYVLGELTEEEARAVKEALIANPEARQTVAELEATVGMLTEVLGGEAVAGLGEDAKERITTEAQRARRGEERKAWSRGRRVFYYGGPLVAAGLMLTTGVWLLQPVGTTSGFSTAFNDGGTVTMLDLLLRDLDLPSFPSVSLLELKSGTNVTNSMSGNSLNIPAVAEYPDPATATTEGLQSPPPVAEPLRYSEAQTAAGSEVPSSPRTEADAAKEKKAEGNEPAAAGSHDPAAEPTAGLQLKSAAPLGDLSVEGVAGSETPPQQSEYAIWGDSFRSNDSTGAEGKSAAAGLETPPPAEINPVLGDIRGDEVALDSLIQQNTPPRPEAPKAEAPKREAATRSIESSQPMPSMEQIRQLEAMGYNPMDEMDGMDRRQRWNYQQRSGEQYNPIVENPFKPVANEPLSTFSIDVDTGAYSNMRRYIEGGSLPPADVVRIEELINYFEYGYPKQTYEAGADPFSAAVSVAACPWTPGHKLVRVGIQGAAMPEGQRPLSNLVFLLDVSGSMQDHTKLPLLKQGLQMLVNQLGENDKVSIVVYAGSAGMVLPPTNGSNRPAILSAIENLSAGGSTAGGQGIQLAYRLARENFIEGGVNRVILATDGDFNVGVSDQAGLIRLIEEQAKSKVFLTVLGFGTGNLQDGMMEQLSNKGNGMYAYIDSLKEAKKVFVEQAEGSLITIAKDVKIQIEFNPSRVQSYRLIGYENRALAARDFNDDTKDAGEIGAGHQVTALYEIVPVGGLPQEGVDPLKYQKNTDDHRPAPTDTDGELMTLKLRYKQPEGDVSKLLEYPIVDSTMEFSQADADFRFASSVAAFGMLLRGSQHKGSATVEQVQSWASNALGDDPHGYRTEFLDLVRKASMMR